MYPHTLSSIRRTRGIHFISIPLAFRFGLSGYLDDLTVLCPLIYGKASPITAHNLLAFWTTASLVAVVTPSTQYYPLKKYNHVKLCSVLLCRPNDAMKLHSLNLNDFLCRFRVIYFIWGSYFYFFAKYFFNISKF